MNGHGRTAFHPLTTWRCIACLSLLLSSLCSVAPAQDEVEPPLPKFDDLQVPEYEALLTGRPVDWLVLTIEKKVLFVDPVQPRPGTLADLAAKHEASFKWPKPRNRDEQREQTEKRAMLQRLQISLWDAPGDSDYLIETRVIERIIYFEDLILQRIHLLLDQQDTLRAYELLTLLDRRQRGWPESDKAIQRFHYVEAGVHLTNDRPEDALRSLEALFALNPQFEKMPERAGEAVNVLVQRAVDASDFRSTGTSWPDWRGSARTIQSTCDGDRNSSRAHNLKCRSRLRSPKIIRVPPLIASMPPHESGPRPPDSANCTGVCWTRPSS